MKIPSFSRASRSPLENQMERSPASYRFYLRLCLIYISLSDPPLRLMMRRACDARVVYDVGAYQGWYSLVLALHRHDILVYAFEPEPDNYKRLLSNISCLGLQKRVIPMNKALSDINRKREFFVTRPRAKSSFSREEAESGAGRVERSVLVDSLTIDHLVGKSICEPPDAIKIDTEGHELEVIQGAGDTLGVKAPQIFFEPHNRASGNTEPQERAIKSFLEPMGYRFENLRYGVHCYK